MTQTSETQNGNNSSMNSLAPLRELSMDTQERCIQEIFRRMNLQYGSIFTDRWRNAKPADMQKFWLEELCDFNGATIGRALKSLDHFTSPPTLPEFKQLCKSFFVPSPSGAPAIEHHGSVDVGDWAKDWAKALESVKKQALIDPGGRKDYKKWAKDIVELWNKGCYPYLYGYELACTALGIEKKPRHQNESKVHITPRDCRYPD